MADHTGPGPGTTLAERLERLFSVHRPPHAMDRPWRNSEVVAACRSEGFDLSASNLSELRRGEKVNPTMRTLDALSWFFQVRSGYFTDREVDPAIESALVAREEELAKHIDDDREARQEAEDATRSLKQALRATGASGIAHRGVGPEGLRQRTAMMRALTDALLNEPDDPDSDRPSDAGGDDTASRS